MSADVLFMEALAVVDRQPLPDVSRRHVRAVLDACRPGPLEFVYEAGVDAGLARDQLLTRAAAIYFAACAVNLADDLIDGDCSYLPDPLRTGPCAQFILHTLFFEELSDVAFPRAVLAAALRDLIAAAGAEHVEMEVQEWSAAEYRRVVEGISGRLFSSYLQILWCETPLASRAAAVGMNAGIAVLVWEDIRSNDPRYMTLPEPDRQEVVAWAIQATTALRNEKLRCLDLLLPGIEPILESER